MNWYIGQEVVYIGPTANGWTHNEDGKITSIKTFPCGCGTMININHKIAILETCCRKHGNTMNMPGDIDFLNEVLFAPLMDITELKEILNEETINK